MRIAALLVVGLLATGCSTSSGATRAATASGSHPAAAVRTVLHTFSAYRADGTPTVSSTRSLDGYCWDSSLAASGPTAFRCFADDAGSGGRILDPCFAPPTPHPTSVSCLTDPWSGATTLHLTRALPPVAPGAAERPWAIELTGGVRCTASTGTVPTVGGTNLSYHCADGTAAALGPVTDSGPWPAVFARPDATILRRTTVAGAWRT